LPSILESELSDFVQQKKAELSFSFFSRGGRIRTCDLLVPNEAR
jgi:hypothetical protein